MFWILAETYSGALLYRSRAGGWIHYNPVRSWQQDKDLTPIDAARYSAAAARRLVTYWINRGSRFYGFRRAESRAV